SVTWVVPAVTTNVATSDVPATVAVIVTFPGAEPSVTCVFAWPAESVVVVAGDTLAAPLVTAKVTGAPFTGPLVPVTLIINGTERGWPTNPTCPLPDTMATADGGLLLVPVVSDPPPHAATAVNTSK